MPPSLYGPNLRNRKIPTETILLSRFHRPKDQLEPRPLYPQKRTFQGTVTMSALCQKQAFLPTQRVVLFRSVRRELQAGSDITQAQAQSWCLCLKKEPQ